MFRIGARPSRDKVFSGDPVTDADEVQGTPLTAEEVETVCTRVAAAVDEIGGKVRRTTYHDAHLCLMSYKTSTLYKITTQPPRAALLLRLPPPSVALTPEVRCAVVGNVDSGKSTTLGVLTRGPRLFYPQSVLVLTFTYRCIRRW